MRSAGRPPSPRWRYPGRPGAARRRPCTVSRSRRRSRRRRRARPGTSPRSPCSATTHWHANRHAEVVAALRDGGIDVLEREHRVLELCGAEVGVAGCKGFGGGFDVLDIPWILRAADARALHRSRWRRSRRWTPACARSRCARSGSRCSLRADHGDAGRRADRHLGLPRHEHLLAGRCASDHPGSCPAWACPRGDVRRPAGRCRRYASVPVLGEDFWVFEMTGALRTPSEVH